MYYYLGDIGFFLILLGTISSNLNYLRIFMVLGNSFLILWASLELNNLSTILWSTSFVIIHLLYLAKSKYDKMNYIIQV